MSGHSRDGADCDYATAAYAGDQKVAIAFGLGKNGLRQLCDQIVQALPVSRLRVRRLARLSAQHRNKAGAEPVDAGIVFIAAGLVDGALAAERSLHRCQRQAIGLRAAIAAAFARSEEHTSELQSLMRISYAVFCL